MTLPTGQSQAFSLNRYLYGASGAVIRIQAGGTSAEEDFQIVSGALVTNDVNEDSISTWVAAQAGNDGNAWCVDLYDQSGNARHLAASTSFARPQVLEDGSGALKNYLGFLGANTFLALGDHLTLGGYTVAAAIRVGNATSLRMLFGSNAGLRWYHGVGNASGQYFIRNAAASYANGGTTDSADHTWLIRGDGTAAQCRVDGTQVASQAYSSTGTPPDQTIGQAGTQGFFFDGRVYEFITWASDLSDVNRDAVEDDYDVFYFGGGGGGGSTIPVLAYHYNQMRAA
jgi:hypothetical protein